MMTASARVMRVTPPMKAPAPMSANAPGSIHAQGLGGRNTPGGALQSSKGMEAGVGGWCSRRAGGPFATRRTRRVGSLPGLRLCTQAHVHASRAASPSHPWLPAPCAAAMSTVTRPTSRPRQAPMSSMGTKTPEEMALPAAGCSGGGGTEGNDKVLRGKRNTEGSGVHAASAIRPGSRLTKGLEARWVLQGSQPAAAQRPEDVHTRPARVGKCRRAAALQAHKENMAREGLGQPRTARGAQHSGPHLSRRPPGNRR